MEVSQYLLFLNMTKFRRRNKIIKAIIATIILIAIVSGGFYQTRTNLQKSTFKTKLLHKFNLIDNTWKIRTTDNKITLITPTLLVDGIFKSMEGPHATKTFKIDAANEELIWLNSFKVTAINSDEDEILSNDFICHSNIDFYDGEHFGKWNLHDRIGESYPRLTTLSNGIESYAFPEGFGFPIFANENLYTQTQILNHNISNKNFKVKHKLEIGYALNSAKMKPLQGKAIYIMLPYDAENPYQGPTAENPNACIPVTDKNHSYINKSGMTYSGHWVVFPGKNTYKFDVTEQISLNDSTSLHHIVTHLHPFAEKFSLLDKTTNTPIFIADAINYSEKIGLKKVTYLSDKKGVNLDPTHQYELILETNNTTSINQDMMASMLLFTYDEELDKKIKAYNSHE